MDFEVLSNFLSSFGFPIVMCGALFWYMVQQEKTNREDSTAMRQAISQLEIAITKLCEKLGGK